MRSVAAYALLASGLVAASIERRFEWPASMPLQARQEPGTPQYACHENCGVPIQLGREEGYCENDEFNTRVQACMECALTYNIWRYYSAGVTGLVTACGFPAPVPSVSGWEPEPVPSTTLEPPTSSDEPVPSTTLEPPTSSDEPVPSSSDAPGSPSTSDEPSSQSATPSSSEPPVVSGSTTDGVPSSSASASASESAPVSESASESGPAPSDDVSVSASASGSPYPVPSDEASTSSEPCPESSAPVYSVPAPPAGNATTLCTTTSKGGDAPYPTPGGDHGYPTEGCDGSCPSTPVSVPSGEPSFEASGATKVFGSIAGVAVAAVAVLAL